MLNVTIIVDPRFLTHEVGSLGYKVCSIIRINLRHNSVYAAIAGWVWDNRRNIIDHSDCTTDTDCILSVPVLHTDSESKRSLLAATWYMWSCKQWLLLLLAVVILLRPVVKNEVILRCAMPIIHESCHCHDHDIDKKRVCVQCPLRHVFTSRVMVNKDNNN